MNLEKERIKALLATDLLDTESETMFDDITKITSIVCKMPIVIISLVDINRQFFKSQLGLNIRQTHIDHSFCKIAIESPNDMLIVEDARLDPRFKDNLLVTGEPNIVSYYGVPLNSKAGTAYGTLCVIDQKVQILSSEQKSILIKLSKQVEYLVELRISNKLLVNYQAKIEKYSKDLEEFSYMAAHDLKAPVRAIHSFISLLDKKNELIWDEKDKKYVAFISQSTLKMNNLIHDLLEFSKSTLNTLKVENFDLKILIYELFDALAETYNARKPVLSCETMPNICSSKVAFAMLFNNLISNALQYQNENENPVIEITNTSDLKNYIFNVKDNGIGMEREYYNEIFKPFKRLHTYAEYPGNGLGLAACAKIVKHLKGTISVQSVIGKGSIFTVKIPK